MSNYTFNEKIKARVQNPIPANSVITRNFPAQLPNNIAQSLVNIEGNGWKSMKRRKKRK